MVLDLSTAGQLGLEALASLNASVESARIAASQSMKMAHNAVLSANEADRVIANIAKLNPGVVGEKVMRFVTAPLRYPRIGLFGNGHVPRVIDLSKIPDTHVDVIPFRASSCLGFEDGSSGELMLLSTMTASRSSKHAENELVKTFI